MTICESLPHRLSIQLDQIEPSVNRGTKYWPCAVTLEDGRVLPRVYFVSYESRLGHVPGRVGTLEGLRPSQVRRVEVSPFRLSASLANALYAAGESGMGYCVFTVEFS